LTARNKSAGFQEISLELPTIRPTARTLRLDFMAAASVLLEFIQTACPSCFPGLDAPTDACDGLGFFGEVVHLLARVGMDDKFRRPLMDPRRVLATRAY
jgi:hypothetical protein